MKSKLKASEIKHISIIMDGNGRWAKSRGLNRVKGHEKGAETLKNIVDYAGQIGLNYLSVFAFSTENWKRPKTEVTALMNLLVKFCKKETANLLKNNCRLLFVGDLDSMPKAQQKAMQSSMDALKDCTGLTFVVFINYGGRADILNACKKLIADGKKIDELDIADISNNLYTSSIPDPDLIIRTSGELRLSNYLLWQASYSELYFTDVYWPDFDSTELDKAILEYMNRNRRFGAIEDE